MIADRARSSPTVRSRLAAAVPALGAVMLALPLGAPELAPAPLVPLLPLLWLLAWGQYQPRLIAPWAAMLAGVVADLAMALPPGVNATLLPALALLMRTGSEAAQRRAFWKDWLIAGPVLIGYQMALLALSRAALPAHDPALVAGQTLVSWALYPAMARAVAWAERRLVGI